MTPVLTRSAIGLAVACHLATMGAARAGVVGALKGAADSAKKLGHKATGELSGGAKAAKDALTEAAREAQAQLDPLWSALHKSGKAKDEMPPYVAGMFAELRVRAGFDWTNAYLLAMADKAAYRGRVVAAKSLNDMGLSKLTWLNEGNLEGFVASDAHNIVVSFRGTEFTSLRDIDTDFAVTETAERGGHVQQGAERSATRLSPSLLAALKAHDPAKTKAIWVSGHSLGGGIAVISAARLSAAGFNLQPVYTFGQYRVGDRAYMSSYPLSLYRVVNENDPVTYLPLVLKVAGYRSADYVHGGQQRFIDKQRRYQPDQTGLPEAQHSVARLVQILGAGMSRHQIDGYLDSVYQQLRADLQKAWPKPL